MMKRSTRVSFIKTKNYLIYMRYMLISKNEPYGKKNSFKHFIGYNDDDDLIRSLCIKSP